MAQQIKIKGNVPSRNQACFHSHSTMSNATENQFHNFVLPMTKSAGNGALSMISKTEAESLKLKPMGNEKDLKHPKGKIEMTLIVFDNCGLVLCPYQALHRVRRISVR
jgi:hypothetical protein